MKNLCLAVILIMLPCLFLHASLMKVTVDAVDPPEGFSTMFTLSLSYENNLCIITISYDSALKEKITEKPLLEKLAKEAQSKYIRIIAQKALESTK